MNNLLFDFYSNGAKNLDGMSLEGMLNLSNFEFERHHRCVQWLFPLPEPSQHNKDAPLLDDETIEAMTKSDVCQANLKRCFLRFEKFLNETKDVWITSRNHNFLRITRVIRCCVLLDQPVLADLIYAVGLRAYWEFPKIVEAKTLEYWKEAVNGEIPGSGHLKLRSEPGPCYDWREVRDFINKKHRINMDDYLGKFSQGNSEAEFLCFWHWLLDKHDEIRNGSRFDLFISDWLDSDEPEWVKDILQKIYDEFGQDDMEFWVSW